MSHESRPDLLMFGRTLRLPLVRDAVTAYRQQGMLNVSTPESSWQRPCKGRLTPGPWIAKETLIEKSSEEARVASKRKLEGSNDADEDPSKRLKLKGKVTVDIMQPTDFHHSKRTQPKKKPVAKIAKDTSARSTKAQVVPQPSNARDAPVASGSRLVPSSPQFPVFQPSSRQAASPTPPPSHASVSRNLLNVARIAPLDIDSTASNIARISPPDVNPTASTIASVTPPDVIPIVPRPSTVSPSTSITAPIAPPEIIPDSQIGSLPDFYTPPPDVPRFTLLSSASETEEDSSVTAPSVTPEPVAPPPRKVTGNIPYKQYLTEDWIKAGRGNKASFNNHWKGLTDAEKDAERAKLRATLTGANK
ncbi:hypothetical protein BJ322DRAFT_1103415 [Thelephora terrestris]|uniref:Uncharacterized protein n=1 Tax=Thelephora terrestris TaxID=56493 RepID=A0A9P6HWF8_9AGAM|nr:hypothetical protein BJ322DRAFT_1103415 [Thelephora terrestris]